MLASPQGFSFILLWTLAAPLGALLSAVIVWLLKSVGILSPSTMEILFLPIYWIVIGVLQWQLLKPYGSWSTQWGVITVIAGMVIILPIILLGLAIQFRLSPQGSSSTLPLNKIVEIVITVLIFLVSGVTNSRGDIILLFNHVDNFGYLVVLIIVSSVLGAACFASGAVMGWLQSIVLQPNIQHTSRWILGSGIAWLVGFVIFLGCYFLAGDYSLSPYEESKALRAILIALIGSGIVSSLIEGVVLVSLLRSSFMT